MQLRYYQEECIASLYDYFRRYKGNPIVALPTGTGKSIIIAEFLRGMFCKWPCQRVMMLTHVKELIAQNFAELVDLWPTAPAGIFSAGLGRKEVRPITFAGIKSVIGKGLLFGHIDIVLIDECHLVSPKDDTAYDVFISELRTINPKIKVIGLTATPYRLGQGLLTEATERDGKTKLPLFTDICYDITGLAAFNRLISEGYLCNLVPNKTDAKLDVSGVSVRGGEFVQGELQAAVDKQELTYAAIEESISKGHDRKHWLVFGTGQRHCEHIVSILDSLGISCGAVTSKTSDEERDRVVKEFKAGRIRALVNNVIFTAGFNFKPIDLIVDLQPTTSASRHVQKYGRGTRPSPETGKVDCLVLDFARNVSRNGPINDPRIPKKKRSKTGEQVEERSAPVKCCAACLTYNHSSVRFCTKCGEEFPPPSVELTEEASTEALIVGAQPEVMVFEVERTEYQKYQPHYMSDKPPSLKVSYWSGQREFSEFVCFEHEGYPRKKARDWWRNAAGDDETEPPATIDEARTRLAQLQRPTHIKVWVNTKVPKIMAYDYSGTAFGSTVPAGF